MKPEFEAIDPVISVVGAAYFQPIADLVERLRTMPVPQGATEVHASRRENGFAAAVCLLSVVALESFLVRARYIKRGKAKSGLLLFTELYPTFRDYSEITEVFVVRDLLAHNHLWEIDFAWDADSPRQLLHANHTLGGDSKYAQHVDLTTRRTRRLGIPIVPSRVDSRDAALVLKTVWHVLEFMDADDHTACPVSPAYVHDGSQLMPFADLVQRFCGGTA